MDVITVLKDLYNISGARVSVHDLAGEELYAYPFELSPFCARIQKDLFTRRNCVDCDKKAQKNFEADNSPHIYRCDCGLLEAVAPIYSDGVLAGFIMMGQVRDQRDDTDKKILESSRHLFGSQSEQNEYLEKIQKIEFSKFESYARLMGAISEYITGHNRLKTQAIGLPEQVKKYIHKNFSKNISLEELSRRFDRSKSTVMNSFKKKYGKTVIAYLNNVRLDEAQKLICDTGLSFKEISGECGFYDQNYFSKQFTERFGCSPTTFRAEYKKGKTFK